MPIPTPNKLETESSFMSRCVSFVAGEGTPQEQAVAICSSQYRQEKVKTLTWKTIDRKRASYLPYAKTQFKRALKAQANEYLDKVKANGISEDYEISSAPIEQAMRNVYRRAMVQFSRDTYNDLIKQANKTERNWADWVDTWFDDNVIELPDLMTNTTSRSIRKIAKQSIIEGWTLREFQNNLMSDYSVSERRAELIGRTEIIRASNAGSLAGAQETNIPMKKFWLSTRDDRTRGANPKDIYDHYSVDENKGYPLDEAFKISGELLMHPGDRSNGARPGNTINCRCTLTYQVIEEDEEVFIEETVEPTTRPEAVAEVPGREANQLTPFNPVEAKFQDDEFIKLYETWYAKAIGKSYRNWDNRNIVSPDLPTIQGELGALQGFKGAPSVVDNLEFQKILDDENYTKIYRGLEDLKDGKKATDMVLDYKYGEMYDGVGLYGDGSYFAGRNSTVYPTGSKEAVRTALVYSDGIEDNIIAGAFRKEGTHIIDHEVVYQYQQIFREKLDEGGEFYEYVRKKYKVDKGLEVWQWPEEAKNEMRTLDSLFRDEMTAEFATMLGFDGMHVPKGVQFNPITGSTERMDLDFYVIFNRTKLIINNKNGY